ncbi:MAG: hypothetical protein IPH82_04315 [Chloroflexi bacterium]|nr:hypothetical protein [Chloroflexota bacterium]
MGRYTSRRNPFRWMNWWNWSASKQGAVSTNAPAGTTGHGPPARVQVGDRKDYYLAKPIFGK